MKFFEVTRLTCSDKFEFSKVIMIIFKSLCYAVLFSSYVWLRRAHFLKKYRQFKKYPLQEVLFSHPRVYQPVRHHWFFEKIVNGHLTWAPFSMVDSVALEEALLAATETIVATDGGRYNVHVRERKRFSVYWSEPPTKVRRCSWFYNMNSFGNFVPYEENLAVFLEKEFREAFETSNWYRVIQLLNGHVVSFHGPDTFVLYSQSQIVYDVIDPCGPNYVIKRGTDDFHIDEGEPAQIDHLLFIVHGVGSACDLQFRSITEVVDEFRIMALQLVQSHFPTAFDNGIVSRIEVLPVCWHASVHYGDTGIDKKLKNATLPSVPFIRNFINDTLLDLFLYGDPTYCQTIMTTVGTEMNRLYNLFKQRNPSFSGGVSVGGHSLGSLILFDLLCHQHSEQKDRCPNKAKTIALRRRMSSLIAQTRVQQPRLQYPELYFQPTAFFALGSPISMFATVRNVDELGTDFKFPTCSHFFNIFHPTDPFAYRIEPLINPELAKMDPVLMSHYKGRKRIHLEIKEKICKMYNLKKTLLDAVQSMCSILIYYKNDEPGLSGNIIEDEMGGDSHERKKTRRWCSYISSENQITEPCGILNSGHRIDYVLQGEPLEVLNRYLFVCNSHFCYWKSQDTMLLILREIYSATGILPHCEQPQ